MFEGKTQGDIFGIYSDNSKMKKILNYNTETSLNSGIKKMIKWSESQFNLK